jgi:hypothetical protein
VRVSESGDGAAPGVPPSVNSALVTPPRGQITVFSPSCTQPAPANTGWAGKAES